MKRLANRRSTTSKSDTTFATMGYEAQLWQLADALRGSRVLPEARWGHLKAQAKQPTIGQLVVDAIVGIERDNPPFDISNWGGERLSGDKCWQYGAPLKGNAGIEVGR